ncbi:hypothetical protein PHET_12245 [Paragonimus heterotremus]|uniref:Microfibrillar-associated protein 1 n=1 Tax=Paragonimus heterotremus TaxID=100268 RepID=A0A8J4SJR2_9TREM|nr:hypothetical protein PHET_12245 [Paragonimus heterotremus]
MAAVPITQQVHSTAGAVPVKNEKGQMYMVKVKVQRYVAGKKPDFASSSSSDSETEQASQSAKEIKAFSSRPALAKGRTKDFGDAVEDGADNHLTTAEQEDPRFRRLIKAKEQLSETSEDEDPEDRLARHKKYRRSGQYSEESPPHSGEELDEDEELDEAELTRKREVGTVLMKLHFAFDSSLLRFLFGLYSHILCGKWT